jgi:TetR/AcrR family transcriptional regulator, cholesterol catabolism regulator
VEEIAQKIIASAEGLFMKYGIKSVTMDDIARDLAISKKTIYQYFKDKTEIVVKVAHSHMAREKNQIEEIQSKAANIIEELIMMTRCMKENHMKTNPAVFLDLRKYYKKGWEVYLEYKNKVFYKSILTSLKRGIAEGVFRPDINAEILATMRLEIIQLSFNDDIFPRDKFDFTEVHKQLAEHFIYGILTIKGKELLEKQLIKQQEK